MNRVCVCIPAHNEATTLPSVVARVRADVGRGVRVLVIDDGSDDGTAKVAAAAGADVLTADGSHPGRPVGKGSAMSTGLRHTSEEIIVFTDADVTALHPRAATLLAEPLLAEPALAMTKARYTRTLAGRADEGGRVNALLARPLLRRLFPELAHLEQPLGGDYAVRRSALTGLTLEPGYGVEIGMLLDLATRHGASCIAEVDLGSLSHRNRPLHQLTGHSDAILHAVLSRCPPAQLRVAV